MISIESQSADAVWRALASTLRTAGRLQKGRDQPTKELLHVAITIADSRQRVVFARPINPAFAIAEVISILSGSDDVSFLEYWNPRMRNYSDDGVTFCGSYGHRLGSQPGLDEQVARKLRHWSSSETQEDQLKMAYEALKHSPDSRQVTLQFWNQNLDMPDPEIRSKDVPCNLVSHLMVRDGKLEWLQVLRSNDFFWGLPYNIIQFTTLQEIMAGWLHVETGSYVQVSDSLHVYQRHWQELASVDSTKATVPRNRADLRIPSYREWESVFRTLVKCALELTEYTKTSQLTSVENDGLSLPPSYRELLTVLTAESLRKRQFLREAKETIVGTSPFWRASWEKWAASTPQKILAQ